jgi:hypothetical protein
LIAISSFLHLLIETKSGDAHLMEATNRFRRSAEFPKGFTSRLIYFREGESRDVAEKLTGSLTIKINRAEEPCLSERIDLIRIYHRSVKSRSLPYIGVRPWA